MNVQVEINGLGRVDFSLAPFGWVRNPTIEFCGIDDEDLCQESLLDYFRSLAPEPFENVEARFIEGAQKDLENALRAFLETGSQVIYVDTISITIRPVDKYSKNSTLAEVEAAIAAMPK